MQVGKDKFRRIPMNVTVFGATGRTGRHVVEKALEAGHGVTAFARTPSKLGMEEDRLGVVQGDVLEREAVGKAIAEADAVISVLGPTKNEPTYTISRGTAHILDAMREHGVPRFIVSVGAGVRDPRDEPGLLDRAIGALLKLTSRHVYEDMRRVAARVRGSDREWTLVRVPMLTDAPGDGEVRAGYLGKDVGARLSREDMAEFMVKQLTDDSYVREAPVISD
jgi:nucleoside-diphosphate-sugar epimerase